jgi:twitching motility protein PilT
MAMIKFQAAIRNALNEGMSDIYITGGHPMVSRKHGKLQFHHAIHWSHQEVDSLVRRLLPRKQLDSLKERKSVDHALSVNNTRLRINFFVTTRGLSLAIRTLPGRIPTIDMLNLHPSLHDIAGLSSGLILACGSTGVGKTSTIAAIIDDINRTRPVHVITLENPVEYRFQSNMAFIQQRELGTHLPSFAQGLIDVLRENPDVIVVGELREPETMKLTLNAAESGHLVIATLHASTPEEAIYRLCNAVPGDAQTEIRYQLASTLSWLIVQQLIYLEHAKLRVPLLTIMRGTPPVKALIRENKLNQIGNAIQVGKADGMYTEERYLNEYLKVRQNFTKIEEVFQPSPEDSQELIYRSPLLESGPETAPPPARGKETAADRGHDDSRNEVTTDNDVAKATDAEEEISIQDLIKQLNTK